MKKLLILLLSFLSTGLLIAQEMKLDDIVEKYLKVSGEEKFDKIETYVLKGEFKIGTNFQITSYGKRPDMERTELVLNGTLIIYVFVGKTGWMVNPVNKSFTPQDMSAEMVKYQTKELGRDKIPFGWNNPIYKWKEKGNKIELVGREDIDGTPVYNLRITFDDGDLANYYIDAEKFLILKMTRESENKGEMEQIFSDYRDFDGIMFPKKLETFNNGASAIVLTFDSLIINVPIDDSKFKKPSANMK
jgi:outer membrane lipoprotein-sorting protein